MFRWFRNFGVFLKKPRGASGRVMHSERAERRSQGGKGGGGGGGGGGHAGHGGHGGGGHHGGGHHGGRSSSNYSTATGRTLSSASYSSAGSRATSSSNGGRSTRSTGSTYSTSRSRDTSNYSTRSTSRATKSSRPEKSTKSVKSTKSTKSTRPEKSTRSTKSTRPEVSTKSTRSSRPTQRSTRSQGRAPSRSPTTRSSCRSEQRSRGRDRTRRNNVNAQHTVLSPTNRSSKLDRSHSRSHEEKFRLLMKDSKHNVWNEKMPKGTIVIYTDGSYLRREGKSGIGIFVGPNHELNRSQKIRGAIQNNQYAEFVAVKTALENLRESPKYNRNTPVIIRTDNLNVIHALRRGDDYQYAGIARQILDICERDFKKVDFQHVYAHEGDPGNEMADLLAGVATSKTNLSGGGWGRSRSRSRNRERNRQRSKSNDPDIIRNSSLSIESKNE